MNAKEQESLEAVAGCASNIAALLVLFPLGVLIAIWTAWIVTILWGWFVSPVYRIQPPSLVLLAGMIVTLRFVVWHRVQPTKKGVWRDIGESIAFNLLFGGMVLLEGWLLHLVAR